MKLNPHFPSPFYCGGPMARPTWLSFGRTAQRSDNYACAVLGHESRVCRNPQTASRRKEMENAD